MKFEQGPILPSRPFHACRGTAILALSATLLATGCVTSRKSEFERHLSATVAQGPSPNRDVALAFSLDEFVSDPLVSGTRLADDF